MFKSLPISIPHIFKFSKEYLADYFPSLLDILFIRVNFLKQFINNRLFLRVFVIFRFLDQYGD